ncbi:MAG: hypothetical protein FWG94_00820 [Oscillospiraceae bacterium]|nr:hypothetical protein [Oscillospiraceae bacterium]
MAGYNTSSAYNLDAFERAAKKDVKSPELKVVKTRRPIACAALNPRVICAFAIIITLISLMVYNQVQLNEITIQLDALSTEMQTLQTENHKMTSALDSVVSLRKIAERAEEMGMQRRDEYQTERIHLYSEDKIERTEQTPHTIPDEDKKIAVTALFGRFKEYITKR